MSKMKIAIFGASGFVGSTLVERLYFEKKYDFVPIIHSYGNAARLARFPISLKQVDVLNADAVKEALQGCGAVVNCIKAGAGPMIKGLKNIFEGCKANKVQKYIHLSSLAIYGDDPAPDSVTEAGQPNPGNNAYAAMKLRQDEMVFKFHNEGTPSIILCPSNIAGPYSPFVFGATKKLLDNKIVLVDEGQYPTNMVHVENLVEAIICALEAEKGWGERYFINEPEPMSWKEFYTRLSGLLGLEVEFRSFSREEVLQALSKHQKKSGSGELLKTLVSGEFRNALSVIPVIDKLNRFAYRTLQSLDPQIQKKLRQKLEKPIIIREMREKVDLSDQFVRVQVRRFFHSPEKIQNMLGYRPKFNTDELWEHYKEWLKFANLA
ncbi:MAG: NAD-dependent epimerase/dehydratase family protein [Calditrichia bacterium]